MLDRRHYATRPFATPMQKDFSRLKDAWVRVNQERLAQGKPKLLQKALALQYGVTETNIGHYLHGREPLNDKWKLRFSKFLGLKVKDIWPDFEFQEALSGSASEDALEFTLEFMELTEEGQQQLRGLIKVLPRRPKSKISSQ